MRYQATPGFFKTKHWAKLWHSNIPDLPSFQSIIGKAGVVAIDAEPWGHDTLLVAEIALSLISPFERSDFDQAPKTIEQMRSRLHISTHSIKICDRMQGKGREKFHADHNQTVPADQVESTLVRILSAFQATLADGKGKLENEHGQGHPEPLILVGFDLAFEFRCISTSYPLITDYFSSWVDLQELVREISLLDTAPTLRNALIAFGYGDERRDIGSLQKKHSAAMDTLRMAALMVSLVFHDASSALSVHRTKHRKWSPGSAGKRHDPSGKLFRHSPPKPRDFHPFMAKVFLRGSQFSEMSAKQVFEAFAQYDPIAAGSDPK